MSAYTSLVDLGEEALAHRDEINEVKRQIGINHGYFDAWIYGFLENKKFNVEETVSKLHRRFAMEINDLGTYELTDFMRASLRKGIIQEIGRDKQGRVAFFVNTRRDFPQSKYRDLQRRTFDMFANYGTRLRADNKRCQLVMLINQKDSTMSKNLDMTFQADTALRISKFYPGGVDKMYICNMGRMLSAMAKPIFKTLPAIVSSRLMIITNGDMDKGALLELFDENVLPIEMGGTNQCDNQEHWNEYADRVEKYFIDLKKAINERGLTVKEFELEQLGIDPVAANAVKPPKSASPKRHLSSLSFAHPSGSFIALQRTVSNWLFGDPNVPGHASSCSYNEGPRSLKSCLSDDDYLYRYDEDVGGGYREAMSDEDVTWESVMSLLPKPIALFLLEEMLRCRVATEKEEVAERYRLISGFNVKPAATSPSSHAAKQHRVMQEVPDVAPERKQKRGFFSRLLSCKHSKVKEQPSLEKATIPT